MKLYDPTVVITQPTLVSYKIDGVQARWDEGGIAKSRAGKTLHNLPHRPPGTVAEVFLGDFKSSISAVKTHRGPEILDEAIYQLHPEVDPRLVRSYWLHGLSNDSVQYAFEGAIARGYEGIVLHVATDPVLGTIECFKLKTVFTHDVLVYDMKLGTGRNSERMGALKTDKGWVGTGFTDKQRVDFTADPPLGKMIEVECMSLTESGKFRHPRFIRIREDLL